MKSIRIPRTPCRSAGMILLLWCAALPFVAKADPGSSVTLWDTGAHSSTRGLDDRSGWNAVPSDLLLLEANPPKARSDPGYYGRDYVFKGDAVVENSKLAALVDAGTGQVTLYSKHTGNGGPGLIQVLHLAPVKQSPGAGNLEILRNSADEVLLRAGFGSAPGSSIVVAFGRNEIVEVKPAKELSAFKIDAAFEFAVVPSFIGDDLIYGAQGTAQDSLNLPNENMLLGLLKGEQSQFVMTWPKGKQTIRLGLAPEANGMRAIESLEFANDGESFYLAPMAAPGIWHKEALGAAFLEKDVASEWKRPFPARWKTELSEEGVQTSFAFREAKGEVWRGVAGSYDYPVWFEDGRAHYRLGKKVQPKGESVVYFLEAQGTPSEILTPVDVLKSTVGRPMAEPILEETGRKLRTHHRRGGDGVHRACTCGCTEAIQAVFEAGEEVDRKDDIKGDLEDMVYFVHRHVDRINEYRRFADDLIGELERRKSASPDLAQYLEGLEQTIQQIPEACKVQQENMKSFDYADELVKKTLALTDKKDPNNLKSYMELLKDWRAMGGAQDYVLAQCHIVTRKLAQEAAYNCAAQAKAVPIAEEVRAKARQCLRNPDGYEIWPDY